MKRAVRRRGGLEGERHVGRALVHAAVHGGIGLGIAAGDGVDHGARLLGGGGRVEIGPAVRDGREIGDAVEGGSPAISPGRGGEPAAGWWRGLTTLGEGALTAPSTTPLRDAVPLPVPGRI
jgi:hypothetical protein